MYVDIEETLSRELREVADGLQIPALPPLTEETPRIKRLWQPLLVAAAVAIILAGAFVVVGAGDGQRPEPAQPPTQSPSPPPETGEPVGPVPTEATNVAHVLQQQLYVDGQRVPGTWWQVWSGTQGWIALRTDGTWWWGSGPEPREIEGQHETPPVISPNGTYVAEILADDGGLLTGFDTDFSGEGLGGVPIDPGSAEDASTVTVRAVTDDGWVIAQGTNTAVLWLPLEGNTTVDLTETAPDQQILGNTPAGLLVNDGSEGAIDGTSGEPYLAEISASGELTPVAQVPNHDDLLVSQGGTWLSWTQAGTTGGEVTTIGSFETQTVDGAQRTTLSAPDGWEFRVRSQVWEDDEHLVSPVVRQRDGAERMARCSPESGECVLIDGP